MAVVLLSFAWVGAASAANTFVDPILLADAAASPAKQEPVIVLSDKGVADAKAAFSSVSANTDGRGTGQLGQELPLVGGVSGTLPAARMSALLKLPGLAVSPNAQLKPAVFDNFANIQLWPYEAGFAHLWTYQWNPAPPTPTIAVVDSGVNAGLADMAGRLLIPQVNLCSLGPNAAGDGRGHGTFVASVLAGIGTNHVGGAPNGKLISIDVMNDQGVAQTSDVIAAAQWIVDHRWQYNIKVANFSLNEVTPSHFVNNPLDKAVEKLWLSGVVVVTAAGNYGVNGQPTQVRYAPGNDPFVISVGALDLKGTLARSDDVAAPWSTYGYTLDGFAKPEIAAAGRYMVGAVPSGSTLLSERPANRFGSGYMQLSGTSFSAPVVAAAAAQLLALHPELSPDQVKGALMLGSEQTPAAAPLSLGAGELNVSRSASFLGQSLPNPNAALDQYLSYNWNVSIIPFFDGDKWTKTIASNPSWDSISWDAKAWSGASDEAKAWSGASWESKAWSGVSVLDSAWASQSRADLVLQALAEGDMTSGAYPLTAADKKALSADPLLAPAP